MSPSRLGKDRKAECPKIPVEGEAHHVAQEAGYDHKRHRITKRQSVIPAEATENALGLGPHPVPVSSDMEPGFYLVEERYRSLEARAIAEQSNGLAKDVPGRPERGLRCGRFVNERPCLIVVFVVWIEAGIEERGIAKDSPGKCHYGRP